MLVLSLSVATMALLIKLVTGRGSFHSRLNVPKIVVGLGRSITSGIEKDSVIPYCFFVLAVADDSVVDVAVVDDFGVFCDGGTRQ